MRRSRGNRYRVAYFAVDGAAVKAVEAELSL
jgi:hypothetical protein